MPTLLALLACTPEPAPAADPCDASPVPCLLEDLTADYVDPAGTPGKAIGLVVGVSTEHHRHVLGFGATEAGGTTPPDATSIFDIASVTKVYTGYLLAAGIDLGEVALHDPIEQTFGDQVPTWQGRSIDLLDLATHSSGLPNYPDNLPNPGPVNPAAGYTLEQLEQFLATHELGTQPATTYAYSNLGSGMLGHVLQVAAGEPSYDALVQARIAAAYELPDTRVDLTPEQELRSIQGHAAGQPAPALDIGEPLQGGGELRATGDDLLRFFEGAVRGDDPAWDQVMTPHRPSPNGTLASTGLLLNIEDPGGQTLYSKNGGAPGFSSQVMFTTDPPAVVVLLANERDTAGLYDLAAEILGEL